MHLRLNALLSVGLLALSAPLWAAKRVDLDYQVRFLPASDEAEVRLTLAKAFEQKNDPRAAMGAREHPRIVASYGGEYHDEKTEKLVARIAGALTAVSENPAQSYRITILNSPAINAFALPGGYQFFDGHGAGHFVKMVHNAIEYGMMAAFAEGFNVLQHAGLGRAGMG
mgnify:CR=1 FL=1